ncbi:MAG: rRNA-processing arch domain-containing protein [Monoraphidium minutum]|nr:MAG: rRNA-processing arch domain-containing protein [Monoraphidium minutum]
MNEAPPADAGADAAAVAPPPASRKRTRATAAAGAAPPAGASNDAAAAPAPERSSGSADTMPMPAKRRRGGGGGDDAFARSKRPHAANIAYVTSGEYIQMSGRAGRRGKDDRGHVVVMVDKGFTEDVARGVMMGAPSPLVSSFRLSYYTLLNLMKRPEGGIAGLETVIANSFQQFQRDRAAPKLREELSRLEGEVAKLEAGAEGAIAEYRELMAKLAQATTTISAAVLRPDRVLGFLRPGRLVHVVESGTDWGWGVVVSVMRRPPPGKGLPPPAAGADGDAAAPPAAQQQPPAAGGGAGAAGDPAAWYIVDVLLACEPGSVDAHAPRPAATLDSESDPDSDGGGSGRRGRKSGGGGGGGRRRRPRADPAVLPVALPLLREISTLRVGLPADLRPAKARQSVLVSLADVEGRYPDGLPRLDPIEDMGIADDEGLRAAVAAAREAEAALAGNEVYKAQRDKGRFESCSAAAKLLQRAGQIRAELRGSALEKFRVETKHRTAVMRRLGFVDAGGVVTLKGQAAACIDTTDELLAAELMFNGLFLGLDKHQLAALVSCLVFVEKTEDEVELTKMLAEPLAQLQARARGAGSAAARHIAKVSNECKVEVEGDEYVEKFRPTLMDVTYRWAKGAAFAEVCRLTALFEGSIIRATRRLDELLTQLADAAGEVGDGRLKALFLEAQAAIRRDIMFAASLYL